MKDEGREARERGEGGERVEGVTFDDRGLVPAVLQDAETGAVLMVAWMNREALHLTQETGEAHFWSRSRRTLWHKGETSGNTMRVREMRLDCDGDTLLVLVEPAGPACHTGEVSCFHRGLKAPAEGKTLDETAPWSAAAPGSITRQGGGDGESILDELFSVILDRVERRPPGSYTAALVEAGASEIVKKVGEEAVEVLVAAQSEGEDRLLAELADLTYHVLVLLAARGLTPADVAAELGRRRR